MMTPLPAALLANVGLVGWRVDELIYASSWDSGIGAERFGGRWNQVSVKAVCCSADPATCLIEVAVHKKFKVLDSKAHVLTSMEVLDASNVQVVHPDDLPNPAWLHGGIPSANQQRNGPELLRRHDFLFLPSAVSEISWTMLFSPIRSEGKYQLRSQERLVVDSRLNPPS